MSLDTDLLDLLFRNKDLFYCHKHGIVYEEKEEPVPLLDLEKTNSSKTLPPIIEENYDITGCCTCYPKCPMYNMK